MVVLESKGMLTAGSNQYLQPDYLSPLPTTLDAKKSPLALLAQTCSQIGADSSKPVPTSTVTSDKKKDEDKKDKSTPTPSDTRRSPAFKPYESSVKRNLAEDSAEEKEGGKRTPSSGRSPSSSSGRSPSAGMAKDDGGRRSSDVLTSSASTTPIIRSGLEVLAGHPKDVPLGTYRTSMPSLFPPGYPGLETHPALRGAYPSLMHGLGFPSSLASYQSAAAALYSSASMSAAAAASMGSSMLASPYLSYTRVKTAGGGEAVVPVCRDPYCTGCPYSVQNNHLLLSGGACPPSCTQCEQAKAALSALPGLNSLPTSSLVPASSILPSSMSSLYQSSSAAAAAAAAASSLLTAGPPRPYVCNWIAGDNYCGKRFASSEDLLQHLRSHTSMSAESSSTLSLLSNPLHAHAALLSSAHAGLHRPGASYPPPSLSPLTASRYHPYAKPPTSLATSLAPSLQGLPYHPSALSAVGYPPGYPSPYASLYQRHPL